MEDCSWPKETSSAEERVSPDPLQHVGLEAMANPYSEGVVKDYSTRSVGTFVFLKKKKIVMFYECPLLRSHPQGTCVRKRTKCIFNSVSSWVKTKVDSNYACLISK